MLFKNNAAHPLLIFSCFNTFTRDAGAYPDESSLMREALLPPGSPGMAYPAESTDSAWDCLCASIDVEI